MSRYISGNGNGRRDEKRLERMTKKPDLNLIRSEIEQALSDASYYYRRNDQARSWWYARWPGQTQDARKHSSQGVEGDPFPWDGASDTRPRTVDKIVRQHLTVAKYAIRNAKVQATSVRPFVPEQGRQASQGSQLLKWMIGTHMHGETRREIPLALSWRFGYGAAIMGVNWKTSRRLEYTELSIEILQDLVMEMAGQMGGDPAQLQTQLIDGIMDPAQEDTFVQLVRELSPVVTVTAARKILRDLRENQTAQVPIPYVFESRPSWTALRPCVEVLFPSETGDLQEARFISQREWVRPDQLIDRIETEDYDQTFVEQALKHRGRSTDDAGWLDRTVREREAGGVGYMSGGTDSERELIELHHFYYKAIELGVPCVYKTVFNLDCISGQKQSYAKHEMFAYDHGQYPFAALRFETDDRPILSSRGIPEIAYTWEQEIKIQRDGRTDRTALVNRPALIVPYSRVNVIKNTPLPGAVLGVTRPNELQFMPTPPADASPIEIERTVLLAVDEYFGLFGIEIDPDLKKARREELGADVLAEYDEWLDQTFALMQQYLPDDVVSRVVGELARPFHVNRVDIQGAWEVGTSVDIHMLDAEYAMGKLDMLGKALAFNTQGTADMSGIFRAAMEIIDPDLAASVVIESEQAAEKETRDEKAAFASIMAGDEPPLPMQGNHQLRLSTLQSIVQANPRMPERLNLNPDSAALLQNRVEFFQRQLAQRQNALIGARQVSKTFSKDAPAITTMSPQ